MSIYSLKEIENYFKYKCQKCNSDVAYYEYFQEPISFEIIARCPLCANCIDLTFSLIEDKFELKHYIFKKGKYQLWGNIYHSCNQYTSLLNFSKSTKDLISLDYIELPLQTFVADAEKLLSKLERLLLFK